MTTTTTATPRSTAMPDLLRRVADLTQDCADAPALCGIDLRISRVSGPEVLLHLGGTDATQVVTWAEHLGCDIRLHRWKTRDYRVVTECAAVREFEDLRVRVWTHLEPAQAKVLLHMSGPAGTDGYSWLPIDKARVAAITDALATATP